MSNNQRICELLKGLNSLNFDTVRLLEEDTHDREKADMRQPDVNLRASSGPMDWPVHYTTNRIANNPPETTYIPLGAFNSIVALEQPLVEFQHLLVNFQHVFTGRIPRFQRSLSQLEARASAECLTCITAHPIPSDARTACVSACIPQTEVYEIALIADYRNIISSTITALSWVETELAIVNSFLQFTYGYAFDPDGNAVLIPGAPSSASAIAEKFPRSN